jgi:transcriptional regulator with XRE-family HTH domain
MTGQEDVGEVSAFYEDFGERIRRARGSMPQRALGERVGLSRGSISNIEGGRQHVPLHLLPRFARALGLKPEDLISPVAMAHDVDVSGLAPDERHFVANVIARARTPSDDDPS